MVHCSSSGPDYYRCHSIVSSGGSHLKVYMQPRARLDSPNESGIRRLCEALEKHLPAFGIEHVDNIDQADLVVGHAGALADRCDVMFCAGLYWTAEMPHPAWELDANQQVIKALCQADQVIVPSTWVATNIARDMRFYPHVIGHGVDLAEWSPLESDFPYVLWAKNRASDACDPTPVYELAKLFPNVGFVTTFYPDGAEVFHNVTVTGQVPHAEMRKMIQGCAVYLSTTQETFGIATLEAMASGKPILGYDWGGNKDLVKHGVNGYLAVPRHLDDLAAGLAYCLSHRQTLGHNSRQLAAGFTWESACQKIYQVYTQALSPLPPTVTIVIPTFNYADKVGRAIDSALAQTYPVEVIVVDDGSTDDTAAVLADYAQRGVTVYHIPNSGVAQARNYGIERSTAKYIACLDADDALQPRFIEALVPTLEADRSIGIAYSGLQYVLPDGRTGTSPWPPDFSPDQQLRGNNQIPTACLFRRKLWERLGGYQPRCCPDGAGFEDADLWLRAVEHGWGAKRATAEPLFIYSWRSGRVSSGNAADLHDDELHYYRHWYPWFEGEHLFASLAKPVKLSHPVRSYDEPGVSVVIPVAPHHIDLVRTALDSVEAQTFRKWEAIVVIDGPADITKLQTAYPYVKYIQLDKPHGAGYARNRGAEQAAAPLLLFLDADDWLEPEFLFKTLSVHTETGYAVYTDYFGIATVDDPARLAPKLQAQLVEHHGGKATIRYSAADFDCQRALVQPQSPPYIWCNITTVVPAAWHFEIGGFDEQMESWEDWLYWLRLAWAGKCFARVAEPLMVYRFDAGQRRDHGLRIWDDLMDYIKQQKERSTIMGCRGCGSNRSAPVSSRVTPLATRSVSVNDSDFVMCVYRPENKGDHLVSSVVPHLLPNGNYGYRAYGDRFLVHVEDMRANPDVFVPDQIKLPAREPAPPPEKPVTIADIAAEVDQMNWGVVDSPPVVEPKKKKKTRRVRREYA